MNFEKIMHSNLERNCEIVGQVRSPRLPAATAQTPPSDEWNPSRFFCESLTGFAQ